MSDLSDWFNSQPFFTRWWLALTIAFTIGGRFGLLRGQDLILVYELFINNFHIWRPITALFYYPLSPANGFHFLMNCYFLYSYSGLLERGLFEGKPADYAFMLIFNWICCVLIALLADIYFLMNPMVLSVMYVWCQLNKDANVSFMFRTQFKAMYLPWVLFACNLILFGGGVMELIGIFVGHLYFFLTFKYPQEMGGPALLSTPSFLYKYFPNERTTVHGFGSAPRRPAEPSTVGGRTWGRGNVLGGS